MALSRSLLVVASLFGLSEAFVLNTRYHQHHAVGIGNLEALEVAKKDESNKDDGISTAQAVERPSIHPATIDALTKAILVRSQNDDRMPLRLSDGVEGYNIMMTAGKIAQVGVRDASAVLPSMTEEEGNVIGGRVVAIINRFLELEEDLVARARRYDSLSNATGADSEKRQQEWFGVVKEEILDSDIEKSSQQLDNQIQKDPSIARSRAECLLALFLNTIEGPGLRANNVEVPCMDVDFLENDRYEALFPPEPKQNDLHHENMEKLQEELSKIEQRAEGTMSMKLEVEQDAESGNPGEVCNDDSRPSLHPLTIEIVSEALKLRAQNDTSAPFRKINEDTEGWEIHYQAGNLAERFINLYQQEAESNEDKKILTQEDCSLIGGRSVGIIMRIEDLEWELVNRCQQYDWIKEKEEWDSFGVLGPEENCIRTLDERLFKDSSFRQRRAERLLALFLLNLEGPGVRAAGDDPLPDGSDVDYLEPNHYEIMIPRQRKAAS